MTRLRAASWLFDAEGRSLRWGVRLGLIALVVLIGLIPYPYDTGGPFTLLPVRETEIHSQVEGEIIEVLIEEGELVRAGQPIAILDARQYERNLNATLEKQAALEANLRLALAGAKPEQIATTEMRLAQAEQELAQALERYEFSRARAERIERAFADRLLARQDYENSIRLRDSDFQAYQVAVSEVGVARAEVDLVKSGTRPEEIEAREAEINGLAALREDLQEQVELTRLKAPVAGQIITPFVEQRVGQYLKQGDLFAKIAESRVLQAEIEVPEEDVADVRLGARVKLVCWMYPDESFDGEIVSVAPAASRTLRSAVVRVLTEIPNEDGRLKPELTGYAKIATHYKPLWKVLLSPITRWFRVEFWHWLP